MKKHLWSETHLWFLWHHTTDTGYVHFFLYLLYISQNNLSTEKVCARACIYIYIYIYTHTCVYIYHKAVMLQFKENARSCWELAQSW